MAHELRNPLTSVKLLLQHAATRPGDAVLPGAKLRLILDEVSRMEGTIQGLLDFSGPPELRSLRHDLCETVRRATTLVEGRAHAYRVELRVDSDESPIEVDGDPHQLHQVFVNLLINGIEAMPSGGLLTISMKRTRLNAGRSACGSRIMVRGSIPVSWAASSSPLSRRKSAARVWDWPSRGESSRAWGFDRGHEPAAGRGGL